MRRIALINQKGGVGKTTTTVNLGAALALQGKRVLVVDLDPQGNLSVHLDCRPEDAELSIYDVLTGNCGLGAAVRPTRTGNLFVVPSHIDLSGAELELAASFGRESLLKDAIQAWAEGAGGPGGGPPEGTSGSDEGSIPGSSFDYLLFDCPPSLGLLSVNGMVAAGEVILTLQTEFFALQGMSKLVDVIALLRRRLNPELEIAGILPCLYDTRLRLAREVLAEIRNYFPGQVGRPIGKNVKLAEAPSYGQTIFEYAPDSTGAQDYRHLAKMVIGQEEGSEAGAEAASAPAEGPEPEGPGSKPGPGPSSKSGPGPGSKTERPVELKPRPRAGRTDRDERADPKRKAAGSDPVELPE